MEQILPPNRLEEVAHNFDAWNRIIGTYETEINRRGRQDRTKIFFRLALSASAMIFAIGLVVTMILLALPKNGQVQVVKERFVVKPEVV